MQIFPIRPPNTCHRCATPISTGYALNADEAATGKAICEQCAKPQLIPQDDGGRADGLPMFMMNRAELVAEAERLGITVPKRATKADIAALIMQAES